MYRFEMEENMKYIVKSKTFEKDEVSYVMLHIISKNLEPLHNIRARVFVPSSEVHYRWTPKIHYIKGLFLNGFQNLYKSNGYSGAPVESLISQNNRNCTTIGLSDTLNMTGIKGVACEQTAEYVFELDLLCDGNYNLYEYSIVVRVDQRDIMYYTALHEMGTWWENNKMNQPAFVPSIAKQPMYSTWYSYHQNLSADALLKECYHAFHEYHCKTIIIDDGWQTADTCGGYQYCGDWRVCKDKIPKMDAFVQKIHELGLKVMLWYSVPFIGVQSSMYQQLKDMVINPKNTQGWYVLDPRYPMVREYIIHTYEQAIDKWDLDGFKLDFIDEFVLTEQSCRESDPNRDIRSVTEATNVLMKDCIYRLKSKKKNILLEFRQTYVGPLMRSFGNMFRAADCPFDDFENHRRIVDIRLLAGKTAVHSDMIMWDINQSVESAAMQIIQVMFAVPQISMRLNELPVSHQKMLRFYTKLWITYQEVLLDGTFMPLNPWCNYNLVISTYNHKMVAIVTSVEVIPITDQYDDILLINGSGRENMYIQVEYQYDNVSITSYNVLGEKIYCKDRKQLAGLSRIEAKISGAVIIRRKQ